MALTMKDFLVGLEGKVDGELEEKRVELIAAIDAKNLKRKNTPTKKQAENEPIKAQIVEYLENEGTPAHSPWWNERMGTRVELYFSL